MKIKNLAKSAVALMMGATIGVSAFAFVGCGPDDDGGDDDKKPPIIIPVGGSIELSASADKIQAGTNETITFTANVKDMTDTSVAWSLEGNGASFVTISNNGVLSLTDLAPKMNAYVTVTATSTVSPSVKASYTIEVIAVVTPGQVGELSTELFAELGNSAITVTGEVEDVAMLIADPENPKVNAYEFKVMMSDGAWYGEWNRKGSQDVEANNYRRSKDPISDKDNRHTFDQAFVNKDNEVEYKPVTDYNSVMAIWEEQHMWNHLAQLGNDVENRWEQDVENQCYSYIIDDSSAVNLVNDLYLRTYLAYSLTPMLDNGDTLDQINVYVQDGKITKMEALTAPFYGEDVKAEDATYVEYTKLTAYFTEVGTTKVPEPEAFEAPRHADALTAALAKMKGATNYTFNAKETTIQAPSPDEGDYTIDSVTTYKTSASNGTSATGQEGLNGYVTDNAVLLARTGKYTSGMDDKLYHTEYSGYYQIPDAEGVYDYFAYDASIGALAGQRQYKGNLFDNMPKFEFSANIFRFAGSSEIEVPKGSDNWVPVYNFTLREPSIMRDVAMQMSMHSYAQDAYGATNGSLKITVIGDGDEARIYSTQFPYSLVSGTYTGLIETTFTNIGSTTLAADTFDGYAPRVVKTNWNQYDVKYYHADHSTQSAYDQIRADQLFGQIFGSEASNVPQPEVFYNAFEDTMSGPFFEWTESDKTASGYQDWISVKLSIDEYDENMKINDEIYDKYISKLTAELAKVGFSVSAANVGTTYWGDRYIAYTNGNIMVKVENNRTRFFDIDIMPVGLWSYNHAAWDTNPNA